jgi:hypothetical protein
MSELSLKKPLGLCLAVVCAAVALSAVAGAPLALLVDKPLYFVFGFELLIVLAGVFGVLIAMGKFEEGPGLSLLCVAAIVGVGTLLGDQTAKLANPISGPIVYHIRSVDRDITMYLALRGVAAALIALGAAWVVLARRPRESTGSLMRGLAALGLLVLVVVGGWSARAGIISLGAFPTTMIALALGVIALGLIAGSVHYIVRAFEFGRRSDGVLRPSEKPSQGA